MTRYRKVRGRWVGVDVDGPVIDIVDTLLDAGLGLEDAEDTALRLVR